MMTRALPALVLVAVVGCMVSTTGCHESLGLVGDASMDPSADSDVDGIRDAIFEPASDSPCPPRSYDGRCGGFSLDYLDYYDGPDRHDITLVCTFLGHYEDVRIVLECLSDEGLIEEHVITLSSCPDVRIDPSLLFSGGDLIVRYIADPAEPYVDDPEFWENRWLTIHSPERGLLVAGVDAENIAPVDEEGWYEPLEVARAASSCPIEEVPCGLIERQGVLVEGESTSLIVLEGNSAPFEDSGTSYHVMVSEAHWYRYIECEDAPLTWVHALIVRIP
jgi:hypothetical protein